MSKKQKSPQPIRQNPFYAAKRPQRILRGNVEDLNGEIPHSTIQNQRYSFGRTAKDELPPEMDERQQWTAEQTANNGCVMADNVEGNTIENNEIDEKENTLSAPLQQKIKKDNRRLVFMNFIFLLFSLISIFSLLFFPFAKIDVKLDNKTIASTLDTIKDESFNKALNGYLTKDDIKNATKDININFAVVNLKTFDFLSLGIDKDLQKTSEIAKKYIADNLVKPVTELVNQAAPAVFALSAKMAISLVADVVNVTAEQFDSMLNTAQSVIKNLEGNPTDLTTAKNLVMQSINPILSANGLDNKKAEVKKQVESILKIIQQNGTADGKFTLENAIGNLDTIIDEIVALGKPTTRTAKANNSVSDFVGDFIANIADPNKLVDDALNQFTPQQKQWIAYGIFGFGLLTCISAAIWAFLALRILVRFFTKKKAVSLWSVIWFGGLQAIWMVPLILLAVFNFANIVQYLSWTWISLAVSLVTMLCYFIFYRGAKKRIKKIHKSGLL